MNDFKGTITDLYNSELCSHFCNGAIDTSEAVDKETKDYQQTIYAFGKTHEDNLRIEESINAIMGIACEAGFEYGFKKAMNLIFDSITK